MKKPQLENWQKAGIILGVVLTITLIVNTSLMAYVTYQNSFKASIFPTSDTGESLDIDIHGIIGRPSPLRYYLNNIKDWVSAWAVGGVEKTNAETGILVAIDGSNIASTASVDYYIEAIPQSGGSAYRFLEGNSSSVTVNGADLDLSNQTTIENHLTAMGLSTDASHTIDYYVYVKAEATGAISGDTLTSEISYQQFDSVTYQYGSVVSETYYPTASADDGFEYGSTNYAPSTEGSTILIQASAPRDHTNWRGGYIRFTGLDIPQGTTISSAKVKAYVAYPSNDDLRCNITADDHDNAPQVSYPNNMAFQDDRTYTTARVEWSTDFGGFGDV